MLTDRFWSKVDVRGRDECWPWLPGAAMKSGHGRFRPGGRDMPKVIAHRYAFFLVKGPIPEGMDVLHSCDNPLCCNPQHLRPGTHDDNMRDKVQRGRAPAIKGNAKLTATQVEEIRRRAKHQTKLSLAKEFGVSRSTVTEITNGRTWQDGGR